MKNSVIGNISKMTATGNRLELPSDLHFDNYNEVKNVLIKAGGKYKKLGFEFSGCAQQIKDRICGGEKIDDKKKYQFFPTPESIAIDLVDFACIDQGMSVLEPSAGTGCIAKHIRDDAKLTLVEINPAHIDLLKSEFDADVFNVDFLSFNHDGFDRIVANPPFTKNQDVDHVLHMYSMLNSGGRLVSVMSNSWRNGSQKKQVEFRNFLSSINHEIVDIDSGAFKESGTNIATCMLIINK